MSSKELQVYWLCASGSTRSAVGELDTVWGRHLGASNTINDLTFSDDNNTFLHAACASGDTTTIRFLLTLGASPNIPNREQQTPFHLACYEGHVEAVKLLIQAGADVHMRLPENFTGLHVAACRGHSEVVALLIAAGATTVTDDLGYTTLHLACHLGHATIVEMLVRERSPPKWSPEWVMCLREAFYAPNFCQVVSAVVNGLPDRSSQNSLLLKTLVQAQQLFKPVEYMGIMHFLETEPQQPNRRAELLTLASFLGHVGIVDLLIVHGADVNAPVDDTYALHKACEMGHERVVDLLLSKGAEVTALNGHGETALHIAALLDLPYVVGRLLSHGAPVEAQTTQGLTALHYAACKGHLNNARKLLAHGANPGARSQNGMTPRDMALRLAPPEVTQAMDHRPDMSA